MEKLKIAITLGNCNETYRQSILGILKDPAILELCTPTVFEEKDALQKLNENRVDALVVIPSSEAIECPADAIEVIITEKTNVVPLSNEPTADDIIKIRDILERDFDLRSPRIAIVQENTMQNSELANQVTAEHNINTYGPYTIDQIMAEDTAWHFDAVITTSSSSTQHITEILSQEIPVRYFASKKAVVTAAYQSAQIDTEGKTTNISWLTHPIYAAIDVIRNRAFYDKARRNPLQKLFRDKRDDRKKEDTTQENANNDKPERAS